METGYRRYIKRPLQISAKRMDIDFEVVTLEGTMKGNAGDYLVVGIEGEKYPIKKEIFEKSYIPCDE